MVALNDIVVERIKSKIQVNDVKDGSGIVPFFTSGESVLHTNDKLITGFNIFLNTGGNAKVRAYFGDAAYSTDTWCITAKSHLQYYLYSYLKHIENQMDRLFFHGTSLKHLQKPLFLKSTIIVPDEKAIERFNSIVEPLYIEISKIMKSNVRLQKTRNKMLPLLINSQII